MVRTAIVRRRQSWITIITILMSAILFGIAFLSPWAVQGASNSLESALFLADIYGANVVSQRFIAPTDDLARVDIWLRNPGRAERMTAIVIAPGGEPAYSGEIPLQDTREPTRYSFRFPPLEHSSGKTVELRLLAPNLSEAQSPAVVFSSQSAASDARRRLALNGRAIAGDVVMALYARPTSLRALGQVIRLTTAPWRERADLVMRRMSQYKPYLFKGRSLVALVALNLALVMVVLAYSLHWSKDSRRPWNAAYFGKNLGLGALGVVVVTILITGVTQNRWQLGTTKLKRGDITPDFPASPQVVYDFIAMLDSQNTVVETPPGNPGYVTPRWFSTPEGEKPVLWMHPPSKVSYHLTLPREARLSFSVSLSPKVWQEEGDGVEFQVILDGGQGFEQIYWRTVDPRHNPGDQRWFDELIDLSSYAGQEVVITLLTYPRGNNSWDWAGWGHPIVIGLP